ncbi:HATPase-c domain-containing protein [Aphelenchoides fujianensis]|nr:HATPase-c domain-containing protein [Aphelenchoides fujianensis]
MASRSAWIGFWVVVLAVGILFWWYMTSGGVQREEEAIQFDGLPEAEVKKLREKAEKHQFQPEVSSLLKEIAGTPHPRQKIFLQSLLWNAATALDKIRLLSLSDPYELSTNSELTIRITVDSEHRKLTIRDTGVGLTRQDLVTLGGDPNQWWLPRMWKAVKNFCGVVTPVRDLIGLFGVRFYSAFAVADRVIVKTKHNGDEQYVMLVSSSGFFIAEDPRGDTLERGTEITLHIKKEAHNFLEPDTIEKLVQKYSQFINVEISLWQLKTITVEEPVEAKEGEGKEEAKPKTKSVEKTFWDQMQVKSFDRDSDMFELKLLALMYSKLQIIDSNTGSWLGTYNLKRAICFLIGPVTLLWCRRRRQTS